MEGKLREVLRTVPRYYEDFETGIISLLDGDEEAMQELINFIDDNPAAKVDDVLDEAEKIVGLEV